MARRRRSLHLEITDRHLERRELLSRGTAPPIPSQVETAQGHPVPVNLFHQDGIDGLKLNKSFVNRLNNRINLSISAETRISQAFQVFLQNYQQAQVNPGPTFGGSLDDLKREVAYALIMREILSNRPQPSAAHGPKIAKLAQVTLVPYALAQIDQFGAGLAATPPVTGPNGTLVHADATAAANDAFNAISNALAEFTIHPHLFQQPSDFYISPQFRYNLSFNAAPATSSPGYFVRGLGGQILPGAILHPFFPA